MTTPAPPRKRGLRALLHDRSGVVDLGSIVVGVVVTSIMSLGVVAVVFGVVPWAQDNAARQSIAAASSAQSVAANKTGRFLSSDALASGGFIQNTKALAAATDGDGSCFVGVAASDSGKVFFTTDKTPEPVSLVAGTKSSCLTGMELQALVDKAGGKVTMANDTYNTYAFGANDVGQLGNNTNTASKVQTGVTLTTGLGSTKISAISAGAKHSCAVAQESKIYCWGEGVGYRLGQGDQNDRLTPVQVIDTLLTTKKITALSAGTAHNCVVAEEQGYCWGYNADGQFGNGSTANSGRPVLIPGLAGKTVTGISAGWLSSCAVADGAAWCWGQNSSGRLGTGTTTNSLVPVKVAGLLTGKTVTEVAAGRLHSCAVANGDVYCWGENFNSQLGNGTTTNSLVPVKVTGLPAGKAVTGLTVGTLHTCGIADGTVYCWGDNQNGQLGNGTTVDSTKATPVSGLLRGKRVTTVSAGMADTVTAGTHTCAVAADTIYCWGYNGNGELGNNTLTSSSVPVKSNVMANKKMVGVSAGGAHSITSAVPIVP